MKNQTYTLAELQERSDQAETCQAVRQGKRFKHASSFYDVCKHVLENGVARFKGMAIDSFSAHAYVKVYEAINTENRTKLETIANNNPVKAMGIVWKLIK